MGRTSRRDRQHDEELREMGGAGLVELVEKALGVDTKDLITSEETEYVRDVMSRYGSLSSVEKEKVKVAKDDAEWYLGLQAMVNGLIFLVIIMFVVWFSVLAGQDKYNARIDYNTDFLDTNSCTSSSDDDDYTCQKMVYTRDHGVKARWIFLAQFVALACACITSYIMIAMGKRIGWLIDIDSTARALIGDLKKNDYANSNRWLKIAVWPLKFLALQSYNNLSVNYSIRHIIMDPIMITMSFAIVGTRDLWTLLFIVVLSFLWNAFIIAGQSDNRFSWWIFKIETLLSAGSRRVSSNRSVARWFAPIAQAILGFGLFSILMVMYVRYPYHARTITSNLFLAVILINIGLRSLFELSRWVVRDFRIMNIEKMSSKTNYSIGSMVFMIVGSIVRFIHTIFFQRPFFIQLVLELYDILILSLPLILLAQLHHDDEDNIARILFPISQTATYA